MPLPDSANIQRYITTLIARTRRGDFVWKKLNPSTYLWESDPKRAARLSLQRIADPSNTIDAMLGKPKVYFYLLQAYELHEGGRITEKLRIDGEVDSAVNAQLENLFAMVQSGITEKGLDFFANLIGGPQQ
jgi:hypothetical protein